MKNHCRRMPGWLRLATLWALLLAGRAEAARQVSLIYGSDDRTEPYAAAPLERAMARSTFALFDSDDVVADTETAGLVHLRTKPFTTTIVFHPPDYMVAVEEPLCKSERFYGQPRGAFCTGFLVGPDLLVTAGHCVLDHPGGARQFCRQVAFVADYGYYDKASDPTLTDSSKIYRCRRVIAAAHKPGTIGKPDWALIRLSRPVDPRRRPPFDIDRGALPKVGSPVLMIGYPKGLPVKIAAGARVTKTGDGVFYADLDAYKGNSGSPALGRDGVVEGILVSYGTFGLGDFVMAPPAAGAEPCWKSELIPDAEGSGFAVSSIKNLAARIPPLRPAQKRRFRPDRRSLRLLGGFSEPGQWPAD
ncbi:MAG: trypsin-like peptidase domain-containing protein [Elusimicrobia bacterium]|nr:trypsin-like peptidase domain-containing protein [Elusimicrobiota bacterium]MDE2424485.1 trypsin-like peptidase domain-containing protein [Elusimicrobiota bacterium]